MWCSCHEWMCVWALWWRWSGDSGHYSSLSLDKRQFCVGLCPNECGRGKNVLCNRVSLNWNSFELRAWEWKACNQIIQSKHFGLFITVILLGYDTIWQRIGTKAYIATLNGATKHFKYCINHSIISKLCLCYKVTNVIKKGIKMVKKLKEMVASYSIYNLTPPLHN